MLSSPELHATTHHYSCCYYRYDQDPPPPPPRLLLLLLQLLLLLLPLPPLLLPPPTPPTPPPPPPPPPPLTGYQYGYGFPWCFMHRNHYCRVYYAAYRSRWGCQTQELGESSSKTVRQTCVVIKFAVLFLATKTIRGQNVQETQRKNTFTRHESPCTQPNS